MGRHQFIVLFRGDDSDFTGNQSIVVTIDTELDLTECKAHFRFLDFKQDFNTIPADGKLELVFPKASTKEFPLGTSNAEMWLEDSEGRRRTIINRMFIVVTNSVPEAYDNRDPQAITVTVSNGSGLTHNDFASLPSEDLVPEDTGIREICGMLNQIKNLLRRPATSMLMALLLPCALVGASVSTNQLVNLKGASNVVTAVSLDGLATTNDVDFSQANTQLVDTITAVAPSPGNYAAVSNAAMNAASRTDLANAPYVPYETEPSLPNWMMVTSPILFDSIEVDGNSTFNGDVSLAALQISSVFLRDWNQLKTGVKGNTSIPRQTLPEYITERIGQATNTLATTEQIASASIASTNYTDTATNELVMTLTGENPLDTIKVHSAEQADWAYETDIAFMLGGFGEESHEIRYGQDIISQLDASTYTNAQQDVKIRQLEGVSSDVNLLSSQVSAIGTHLNAEDAHFVSTNYDSVVRLPEAYVEIKMSNTWITIWREMTRWDKFVGIGFNWSDWGGMHAFQTNVITELSYKADRAWGVYDSETGGYSPEGYTQVSSSNILIAAGMAYQRTVTSAGSVWILQCNSGTATIGGDTNGYFRVLDGDGNTQFEIVKGDRREMGADASGITVGSGSPPVVTIPYSIEAAEHPVIQVCDDLQTANWKDETDGDCIANVSWSGTSGAYVATVQRKAAGNGSLFVKATYMAGGETYIKNVAPISVEGGILCTDGIHKVRPVYNNGNITWTVVQ